MSLDKVFAVDYEWLLSHNGSDLSWRKYRGHFRQPCWFLCRIL